MEADILVPLPVLVILTVLYVSMAAVCIFTMESHADIVKHGGGYWEVSPDGYTTFKWNNNLKAE